MGLIASGLVLSRNSTLSGTFALSKPSFPYCRVPSTKNERFSDRFSKPKLMDIMITILILNRVFS
jgi:hypothetical protein